jgi:hypothetical protein
MEMPSFATPSVVSDVLRGAGYETLICERPGDTAGVCRLLETGECSLVRDADVVFNAFGITTEEHSAILTAVRDRYPDTPVVVEVTGPRAVAHAGLLADCTVCTTPVRARELIEAIAAGLSTQVPVDHEANRR